MDFFEKIGETVMNVGKEASGKAKELVELASLKSQIHTCEEVIKKNYQEIGNVVRFAPSACNTQPWKVEAVENELKVYRYKKPGKRGIMPADKVAYYNRIDIGIFLLFLESCLEHGGIEFDREVFSDNEDDISEEVVVARYKLSE